MPGSRGTLLVLDFDGVICDSVEECFVASWTAFHEHVLGRPGRAGSEAARAAFRALRPFVRSGEDFVLIQQLVEAGRSAASQEEFDAEWDRGDPKLGGRLDRRRCKDLFYLARTELQERDPAAWLRMNPVFPHVPGALARLSAEVPRFMLSTKKPPFVIAPLEAARLPIPRDHVLYSESEPKLLAVERLLEQRGCREAVFVEDQVDAIRGNRNPRVRTFLATWGYVQKAWLEKLTGTALLTPEGFSDLLAAL